jgi:hypothetical protein
MYAKAQAKQGHFVSLNGVLKGVRVVVPPHGSVIVLHDARAREALANGSLSLLEPLDNEGLAQVYSPAQKIELNVQGHSNKKS